MVAAATVKAMNPFVQEEHSPECTFIVQVASARIAKHLAVAEKEEMPAALVADAKTTAIVKILVVTKKNERGRNSALVFFIFVLLDFYDSFSYRRDKRTNNRQTPIKVPLRSRFFPRL